MDDKNKVKKEVEKNTMRIRKTRGDENGKRKGEGGEGEEEIEVTKRRM